VPEVQPEQPDQLDHVARPVDQESEDLWDQKE